VGFGGAKVPSNRSDVRGSRGKRDLIDRLLCFIGGEPDEIDSDHVAASQLRRFVAWGREGVSPRKKGTWVSVPVEKESRSKGKGGSAHLSKTGSKNHVRGREGKKKQGGGERKKKGKRRLRLHGRGSCGKEGIEGGAAGRSQPKPR